MAYNHEDAPNTRLFIMCGKGATDEMLKKTFATYGTIKDLWIVKDRRTNEEKGMKLEKTLRMRPRPRADNSVKPLIEDKSLC